MCNEHFWVTILTLYIATIVALQRTFGYVLSSSLLCTISSNGDLKIVKNTLLLSLMTVIALTIQTGCSSEKDTDTIEQENLTAPAPIEETHDMEQQAATPDQTKSSKMNDDSHFIGLTLEQANVMAPEHNFIIRVVKEDGKDLSVTMDYLENRLNIVLEDGKITAVHRG